MGEHPLNEGRREGRGQTSVTALLCCKLHAKQEPLVFQELRVLELTVLTSLAEPFLLNHTVLPGCAMCMMCYVYDAAGRNNAGFKGVSETLMKLF